MKTMLVMLVVLSLNVEASAQRKIANGNLGNIRPRVSVVHVSPVYGGLGFGYGSRFGYNPYYDPFYNPYNRVQGQRPTQLDLDIDDIKNDYSFQLSSVRRNNSISRHERRDQVRKLKHERDDAIIAAKRSYYKQY